METSQTIRINILGPGDVPLVAEVWVYTDTVEIWVSGDQHAVFDREQLAAWLNEPVMPKPLESTGATLSVDLEGHLVVYLPDVPTWVRASLAEQQLREALA